MLNIHDAANEVRLAETLNSAALSASQAGQSNRIFKDKYVRQRKRKVGSNNRSALEQQAAAPQIHDSHDADTVINENNSCVPASGDASLEVAKYLPSQQQMAYTPNIASRKDLKPGIDPLNGSPGPAHHTQEKSS